MDQNFQTLLVRTENGVLDITINRPKALNALNEMVLDELLSVVDHVGNDIRIVVFRGAGEKAFVAGADIAEMQNMNAEQAQKFSMKGQKLTRNIENLNQPTIALVHGFALGGGCELAMSCDIILTTKNAKFGQPEVHLGLIPGFGGTQRLVRRIGYSKAMDMLLSGRPIDGTEAYQLGLAAHVADDPESMHAEFSKISKGIMKSGRMAIAMTKSLAQKNADITLEQGLFNEAHSFATCFENGEGKEGIEAFLTKRPANFSS